jgi:hypothetical protein
MKALRGLVLSAFSGIIPEIVQINFIYSFILYFQGTGLWFNLFQNVSRQMPIPLGCEVISSLNL